MCNAAKHPPGCSCGFGPPYPPSYQIGEVTEWAEEAVDRPTLVRRGLRETGWDERAITAFAERYAALRREALPRTSRVERVRELLGMRRREVEETVIETVDVPLYRFAAPPVQGAKVEYSEGESVADGGGWSLKFFGVGTANTTSLEVAKSVTYAASGGATKQVYVPVQVRVSRVAVYEGDRLVGRGHVAAVAPPSESGDPLLQRRGVRSVDRATLHGVRADGTLPYHDVVDLALAGDTTGAVHKDKRAWVTDVAREVSVSLAKAVETSALVRIKRTRRLELASELPSGHDYRAFLCNGFMYWDAPTSEWVRRAARSRRSGVAA